MACNSYTDFDNENWNFFCCTIKNDDYKSISDIIVAFVDKHLTRKGFLCLGVGEETTIGKSEIGNTTLPEDWNKSPVYSLRYVKDKKLYILKAVDSGIHFIINLVEVMGGEVTNLVVNMSSEVQEPLKRSIIEMTPIYIQLIDHIETSLIEPLIAKSTEKKKKKILGNLYFPKTSPPQW